MEGDSIYCQAVSMTGRTILMHRVHYCAYRGRVDNTGDTEETPGDQPNVVQCRVTTDIEWFGPLLNSDILRQERNDVQSSVGIPGYAAWLCPEHRCAACYGRQGRYQEVKDRRKVLGAVNLCEQCREELLSECASRDTGHEVLYADFISRTGITGIQRMFPGCSNTEEQTLTLTGGRLISNSGGNGLEPGHRDEVVVVCRCRASLEETRRALPKQQLSLEVPQAKEGTGASKQASPKPYVSATLEPFNTYDELVDYGEMTPEATPRTEEVQATIVEDPHSDKPARWVHSEDRDRERYAHDRDSSEEAAYRRRRRLSEGSTGDIQEVATTIVGCVDARCVLLSRQQGIQAFEGLHAMGVDEDGVQLPRHRAHYCAWGTGRGEDRTEAISCRQFTKIPEFGPYDNNKVMRRQRNAHGIDLGHPDQAAWLCFEHRCRGCYYFHGKFIERVTSGEGSVPLCNTCKESYSRKCNQPQLHEPLKQEYVADTDPTELQEMYPGCRMSRFPVMLPWQTRMNVSKTQQGKAIQRAEDRSNGESNLCECVCKEKEVVMQPGRDSRGSRSRSPGGRSGNADRRNDDRRDSRGHDRTNQGKSDRSKDGHRGNQGKGGYQNNRKRGVSGEQPEARLDLQTAEGIQSITEEGMADLLGQSLPNPTPLSKGRDTGGLNTDTVPFITAAGRKSIPSDFYRPEGVTNIAGRSTVEDNHDRMSVNPAVGRWYGLMQSAQEIIAENHKYAEGAVNSMVRGMMGPAKTGLIAKVLFRGMDRPNLSHQIPFLDNTQSKHQALTILLTFLTTVHFLQYKAGAGIRGNRPSEPFHALLYGVDHPIPPEFYIRLGECEEIQSKDGFNKLLAPKRRAQEEPDHQPDIEWMRKEVVALFVQYQIAFADRLDALKLGVELAYLREMSDKGMSIIAKDKTRDGIAKSTGFQTYEEFAIAVELAQDEGVRWTHLMEDGLTTVYTNGVAVLYGWSHMRRRKSVVMPLKMTSDMAIRSQLALRMPIPKAYNSKVASLQALIRALRLTIGDSLVQHVESGASGIEEVSEHIHLLKVCASYDPVVTGGQLPKLVGPTGAIFTETLQMLAQEEVESLIMTSETYKLLLPEDEELFKAEVLHQASKVTQPAIHRNEEVISIADSDSDSDSDSTGSESVQQPAPNQRQPTVKTPNVQTQSKATSSTGGKGKRTFSAQTLEDRERLQTDKESIELEAQRVEEVKAAFAKHMQEEKALLDEERRYHEAQTAAKQQQLAQRIAQEQEAILKQNEALEQERREFAARQHEAVAEQQRRQQLLAQEQAQRLKQQELEEELKEKRRVEQTQQLQRNEAARLEQERHQLEMQTQGLREEVYAIQQEQAGEADRLSKVKALREKQEQEHRRQLAERDVMENSRRIAQQEAEEQECQLRLSHYAKEMEAISRQQKLHLEQQHEELAQQRASATAEVEKRVQDLAHQANLLEQQRQETERLGKESVERQARELQDEREAFEARRRKDLEEVNREKEALEARRRKDLDEANQWSERLEREKAQLAYDQQQQQDWEQQQLAEEQERQRKASTDTRRERRDHSYEDPNHQDTQPAGASTHRKDRRSISQSNSQPRAHLKGTPSPLTAQDQSSDSLSQEKLEYILFQDDSYEHSLGTIGRPDPSTGHASTRPHPSIDDSIMPVSNILHKRRYTQAGDAMPDNCLGVYTNVADWINEWDTKATSKEVTHEEVNAQMMRGGAGVFAPEMKALIMSYWKQAREYTGDKGKHLIQSAMLYPKDKRVQFFLYCRLRMDLFKIIHPDPIGERGDRVEKGILAKIKAVQLRPDMHKRPGRASLSNLHIAVATLRDLHRQKNGNAGEIDEMEFDTDVEAMLQRHDQANKKGRLVERAFRDVESEVMLARQTARGVRDGREGDNETMDEILMYIRSSATAQVRVHEDDTPPAQETQERQHGWQKGHRGSKTKGYHVNHIGEASHVDDDEDGYIHHSHPGLGEALMIEEAARTESFAHSSEDQHDQDTVDKGRYPIALVHTAMAVSIAQEEQGKPLTYCTWCGARTCQSVVIKGNQCQLVWLNTRTGAALLSTRKFGLIKHTSEAAFNAAFQEAQDHGMLQGAAQKDIQEFMELVDQSVKFYIERDNAYQESRRNNTNPYRPPQDARQEARGGYHNGSSYPPAPPAARPSYGGYPGQNNQTSRFQAFAPTQTQQYRN